MYRNTILPALLNQAAIVFLISGLISCADDKLISNKTSQSPQSDISSTTPAAATSAANTGVVKSIQNAGGYSYIEVDINGQVFWMAASISSVKPGEKIAWKGHAMMNNFVSKTMNRTFERIMFVDKVLPASVMQSKLHSGRVIKTMDSAGYSYIQVEEKGKKIWLAAPVTKISVGQNISWNSGAAMQKFSSRSLNRTFEEIFFISGVKFNNS